MAAEGAAISVWAIGDGIAGGAGGELPGRLEPAAARDISGRGIRRVFALKFQAGEIDVFIPWRGWQPRVRRFLFGRSVMASRAAPAVSYRDGSSQRPLAT